MKNRMRISIVGTGYVGLVSAACFAEHGHDVTCVDVDPKRIDAVNAKRSPLHEPGLTELLERNVPTRLRATGDLVDAVLNSELTIIAVPTPFDAATGSIDLSYVLKAAGQVGEALRDVGRFHAIVVKSTCAPGTADGQVRRAVEAAAGEQDLIGIGSCPEFLSEGTAVHDFMHPDRIVLGAIDERTLDLLRTLHSGFVSVPTIETNCRTAEAIKYASNAFLATCVSFANEIANVCEAVGGIDADEVMQGVHLSRYLTADGETAAIASFLRAGCGYGGSCLPKDVAALVAQSERLGQPMPLLSAVAAVNDARAGQLIERLTLEVGPIDGKRVTVLGTAFKPGTADLRTSPAEPIVERLVRGGATVTCHDPAAGPATRDRFGKAVRVEDDLGDAVLDADAVVVVTAWDDYRDLPRRLNGSAPVIVDGRRMFEPSEFKRYIGVGLAPVHDGRESAT